MLRSHKSLLHVIALTITLLISGCAENGSDLTQAQILAQAGHSIVQAEAAVSVGALSGRIIKQQNDYLLYDVRPRAKYDIGHIKTAESIGVMELLSEEKIKSLSTGRDVFIYSDYCGRAAQIATVLRTQGVPAYYLIGGYDAWSEQMTDVSAYTAEGRDARELAKQQAISCWFEGEYVAEAGLTVKAPVAGGYVPLLEPVKTEPEADPLGLGLGLGLGPEDLQEPEKEDPLGLGLGIGLGPEDLQKSEPECKDCTLRIGEGC